ncbi:hypothetical protein ACWESM_13495 [Nocardia sp. NPDC003999]
MNFLKETMSPPTSRRSHRLHRNIINLFASAATLAAVPGLTACASSITSEPAPVVLVVPATSAEPLPTIPKSVEAELISYANQAKHPGDAIVRIVSLADGPVIERDLTPLR